MSICTIATGFKKEFNGYQLATELQRILPSIDWRNANFKPKLDFKEVSEDSVRVNFRGEVGDDCYITIFDDKKGLCACTYAHRSAGASAIQEIAVFDMIKNFEGVAFYETNPFHHYFYNPKTKKFEEEVLDEMQ